VKYLKSFFTRKKIKTRADQVNNAMNIDQKALSDFFYSIEDIWDDSITLSVSFSEQERKAFTYENISGAVFSVEINHTIFPLELEKIINSKCFFAPIHFNFYEHLVTNFSVKSEFNETLNDCSNTEPDKLKALFEQDYQSLVLNIKRRKSLVLGRNFQLVAALQAYHWATLHDHLDVRSFSICSVAYRYTEYHHKLGEVQKRILQEFSEDILSSLNLREKSHARWYPSIKLAIGQLLLTTNDLEKCINHLKDISDNASIIEVTPICAYNISIGNCLLSYLLFVMESEAFEHYAKNWEYIFRASVKNMEIRFGTIHEFGAIYQSLVLNYSLILSHGDVADRRMKSISFDEIMRTCVRARSQISIYNAIEQTLTDYGIKRLDFSNVMTNPLTEASQSEWMATEFNLHVENELVRRPRYRIKKLACPICADVRSKVSLEYPSTKDLFFINISVLGCQKCGFSWVPNKPYGLHSYSGKILFEEQTRKQSSRIFEILSNSKNVGDEAKEFIGYSEGTIRTLVALKNQTIVGSGEGFFDDFDSLNFEKKIFVSDYIDVLSKKEFQNIELLESMKSLETGSVDIVSCSYSLENMYAVDFVEFLKEVRRIISGEGTFLIEVQNASLLNLGMENEAHVPNLCFFTCQSLRLMLDKFDFTVNYVENSGHREFKNPKKIYYRPVDENNLKRNIILIEASAKNINES